MQTRLNRIPSAASLTAIALFLAAAVGSASSCRQPPREAVAAPSAQQPEAGALHAAARAGRLSEVRSLIESGRIEVDAGDRYRMTAMMMAAERGHLEVVRYLLKAGAEIDRRETFFNRSAFDLASAARKSEILVELVSAGCDQRDDALRLALQTGNQALAQAAVDAGPITESTLREQRENKSLSSQLQGILAQAKSRPDPAPPSYSAEQLKSFEGQFESWDVFRSQMQRASVALSGPHLELALDDRPPVALSAIGEREFRTQDGKIRAAFWGRLGTIESLILWIGNAPPLRMRHSIAEPLGPSGFDLDRADSGERQTTVHWPQFRGKGAGGIATGMKLPLQWDPQSDQSIRWTQEIAGLGNSSPIVWGGKIFVTTAVAKGMEQNIRTGLTGAGDQIDEPVEHSWRVIALDKRSGKVLWERVIGQEVPLTSRHFKASQANSTPVTDGRYLVAVFPTAGIACLNLEGEVLWKHRLGGLNASSPNDPSAQWSFASSPVIYRDSVILQVDVFEGPYLAAWDLASGKELWRTRRDGPPSWSTPTLMSSGGSDELVVNGSTIRGYDPATGKELWSLGPNSELVIATPVADQGVAYVSAGYAPVKPIYAIRAGTRGSFEVKPGKPHERLAWSHNRGGAYMPTPLLYRGLLYVVHHNGRIVAYDAEKGAPIYKKRFSRGGTFTASPVAADGKLFIPTEEGRIYVIQAGPEFKELAANEMGEPVMATPAISEGQLVVRTTRRLVAIGE